MECLKKYLDSCKMLGSKVVRFFMLDTMACSVPAQLQHGSSQKSYVHKSVLKV